MTVPVARRSHHHRRGGAADGQVKAQFAMEGDTFTFNRRPLLPTYVPPPTTPAPQPGDEAYSLIPQGVDEDGQVVHWDITGACAHFSGQERPDRARSTRHPRGAAEKRSQRRLTMPT